jgi:hypothetical protein
MTSRTKDRLSALGAVVSVLALVSAGIAWAASAKVDAAVSAAVAPVVERVAKLETGREDDKERLQRIEDKVDFLVERLVAP